MKVYLAGSHLRRDMIRKLVERSNLLDVTFDWTKVRPETYPGGPRQLSQDELRGVQEADVVVVLLPGGPGTHTELGYALGKKVSRVLIVDTTEEGLNWEHNLFYLHPTVWKIIHYPMLPEEEENPIGLLEVVHHYLKLIPW